MRKKDKDKLLTVNKWSAKRMSFDSNSKNIFDGLTVPSGRMVVAPKSTVFDDNPITTNNDSLTNTEALIRSYVNSNEFQKGITSDLSKINTITSELKGSSTPNFATNPPIPSVQVPKANTILNAPTITPYNSWNTSLDKIKFQLPKSTSLSSSNVFNKTPNIVSGTNGSINLDTSAPDLLKDSKAKTGKGGGRVSVGQIASAVAGAADGFRSAYSKNRPEYSLAANNGFSLIDKTLTGGKKSRLGMAFVNTGATLMNTLGSTGYGAMAAGIIGALGSIINNGWGYDIENADAVMNNTAKLGTTRFTAQDLDSLTKQYQASGIQLANIGKVKNGLFTNDGTEEANKMLAEQRNAYDFAMNSFDNAAYNIYKDNLNANLATYSAYGGPLDRIHDNMGSAIDYNFMSRYFERKDKEANNKNKITGISPMPTVGLFGKGGCLCNKRSDGGTLFALGGDYQTNGSDWTTGLTHIDAGSSHEMNPNEGVQVGVDPEGKPNLVEEGEVIFNDYVYSNRIKLDNEAKKAFHFGKKQNLTYAEAAKKLEKESSERPNDPISKAALKAQMEQLAEHQERQKQEMEAEKAKQAFEAMSPEEQVAVMQQMQQRPMTAPVVPQQQQVIPEEADVMQQQMMEQPLVQAALGGPINTFSGLQGSSNLMDMDRGYDGKVVRKNGLILFDKSLIPALADDVVITGAKREKPSALELMSTLGQRRRDRRIDEYLAYLTEMEEEERDRRNRIHYYAPGGDMTQKDEAWYNNLSPFYQWIVRTHNLKTAEDLEKINNTYLNALQGFQNQTDLGNIIDTINGDEDIMSLIAKRGLSSGTLEQITPEQWNEIMDEYVKEYNDFVSKYPTIPYARRREDVHRRLWDPTYEGYEGSEAATVTPVPKEEAPNKEEVTEENTNVSEGEKKIDDHVNSVLENIAEGLDAIQEEEALKNQTTSEAPVSVEESPEYQASPTEEQQAQVKPSKVSHLNDSLAESTDPRIIKGLKNLAYRLTGYEEPRYAIEWLNHRNIKLDPKGTLSKDQKEALIKEVSKKDPIFAHSILQGYTPFSRDINSPLTFDFIHGGWGKEGYSDWDGSTDAAWQEAVKKGLVRKGMSSEEIGKALMQTDAYKRGTSWLQNSADNRLRYLSSIADSKDAPAKAREYARRFINNNGGTWAWNEGMENDYNTIFGAVRSTHPGTYWKTPEEVLQNNIKRNYLLNADNSITPLNEKDLSKYIHISDIDWDGNSNSYYKLLVDNNEDKKQNDVAAGTATDTGTQNEVSGRTRNIVNDEKKIVPVLRKEWPRYAGLFGPVAGLGMMAAGVGKPDFSGIDAAMRSANAAPALAKMERLGNYRRSNLADVWAERNQNNANFNATARGILNLNQNSGLASAALLANNAQQVNTNGDLLLKGLKYDNDIQYRDDEFNKDTDKTNAMAYNQLSQFNADALNRARQYGASLALHGAAQKLDANAGWYNSLYGNMKGLFKGIGDLGRENADHNMIARLVVSGAIPGITPEHAMNAGFAKYAAEGGKFKKKKKNRRGLTY